MERPIDPLTWIQDYVYRNADGEWENTNNISIEIIDNPGLMMRCDIDTYRFKCENYAGLELSITNLDWIITRYDSRKSEFFGVCGVKNLT